MHKYEYAMVNATFEGGDSPRWATSATLPDEHRDLSGDSHLKALNKLGREGWMLVTQHHVITTSPPPTTRFIFWLRRTSEE